MRDILSSAHVDCSVAVNCSYYNVFAVPFFLQCKQHHKKKSDLCERSLKLWNHFCSSAPTQLAQNGLNCADRLRPSCTSWSLLQHPNRINICHAVLQGCFTPSMKIGTITSTLKRSLVDSQPAAGGLWLRGRNVSHAVFLTAYRQANLTEGSNNNPVSLS